MTAPSLSEGGYAVPNPFFAARGQRARFVFAAGADATIKIYTIEGSMVRTLTGTEKWDGKDNYGRLCESGLYIFQITDNGTTQNGTVVMIAH